MKTLFICARATAISLLLMVAAAAQQANDPPLSFPKHVDVAGQRSDDDWYMDMVRRSSRPTGAPTPKPEPRVIKKGPLAPAISDREAYAGFLRTNDTGLIKLMPQTFIVNAHQIVRSNLAKGNDRYSFSYRLHNYNGELELSSDLVCKGNLNGSPDCQFPRRLTAGGYGFLTNLGQVALAQLSADDARAQFMISYPPPRSQSEARCDMLAFRKGVDINGQHYQDGLPINVGSTYLVRAFNYATSDVVSAFQVVREEGDGTLTIAWKLLKQLTPRKMENVIYVNQPTDKCPIK